MFSPFRRGQVAAAAFLVFLPSAGLTQTIVVTGTREPLAVERLAADVAVIDSDTLRDTSADSLADLLRREAGLQMSRNGGPGQNTGIFIRGAFAGQTVVLVDGVRIGSATLGYAALEGLALSQIERVEVLRGPGSSVHGADAVGGVVQVFTRRGEPGLQLQAQAATGGYNSREARLALSGRDGRWDGAATLASESSAGISALRPGDAFGNYNPDRDGYRLNSGQAQLGFKPAADQRVGLMLLRTRLTSQYDASEYPPPNFSQDSTPDFRSRTRTDVTALDWRGAVAAGLSASARIARSSDTAASGGNALDQFRTTREQFDAQLAWATGVIGQLIGAVEQRRESAQASAYTADVSRRNTAAVAALTGHADAWSWQADLRHDRSSDVGGVTTARLGGAYALAPGWKLRALAGNTFRTPSFNDLYYPGYGVPSLKPERGRSVELGLSWRGDAAEAAATAYRNQVRQLVAYEGDRSFCPPDPSYDFGCARNIARARLSGATLSGRQRLDALTLKAQIDFLAAHDEASGRRLARRAAHQASLAADWDGGPWSAGANLLRVGARPDGGKTLAAETTLDLHAQWKFAKAWTLQSRLLNATNRDTEPARDFQGLGRQAWLGLRFEGGP